MSVLETNHDIPLNDRVEFHVDRVRATTIALAAILSGFAIAAPPVLQTSPFGSGPQAWTTIVALGGASTLVAAGFAILMRVSMWRGPAVVIDSFGIHDRRTGAIMTPWSRVHDVRVLDRHGHHIAIDLGNPTSQQGKSPSITSTGWSRQPESLTVIDTFFLRSATGNRVLDFIMPLTALTPLDLSETPVSPQTLSNDASIAQRKLLSFWIFLLASVLIPGIASLTIAF